MFRQILSPAGLREKKRRWYMGEFFLWRKHGSPAPCARKPIPAIFSLKRDTQGRSRESTSVADRRSPAASLAGGSSRRSLPPQKASIGLCSCPTNRRRLRRMRIALGEKGR